MTRRILSLARQAILVGAMGVAAPAFAQQAPNARQEAGASYLQRSSTYAYERNGNANRDFQLGGSRWKALHHRARPASRSVKKK